MQKPKLDRMWETFVRIPPNSNPINLIRFQIIPLISQLKDKGHVQWYHFLVHNRESGVPTSDDDKNAYFHIRFEFEGADPIRILPDYCVMTQKTRQLENITGIEKSLLKNEEIEEAWRIIGEQSEWLINMLSIYKEDRDIPPIQTMQYLHYYFNMMQLGVLCPICGKPVSL